MSIESPTQETIPTREDAILAFQQLRERVVESLRATVSAGESASPFDTIPQTQERLEAEKMLTEWRNQAESIGAWCIDDLRYRINLQQTMIYVEAGFHDFEYLSQILSDLKQSSNSIEKIADNPVRIKTRQQIKEAELKIKKILAGETSTETNYDLSDIDLNQEIEQVPTIDLLQEIEDANEKALSENPDYKKSDDAGIGLVWKHLSDGAKSVWNSQIWNKRLLSSPEAIEKWNAIYPDRKIREAPLPTKKVKIDSPR